MRLRAALAGILAVAAGTATGVALAGGDARRGTQTFSNTSTTVTVTGGAQEVARAGCGSQPVVGGGVDVSPARRGSEVASSLPREGTTDQWEAWANNDRGSSSEAVLVSHAVCDPSFGLGLDLSYVQRQFAVPNNTTRTTRRHCPGSDDVLSGGVYLTGSGMGAEVPSMGPFDDGDADRRPDDGFGASASGDREGPQTATVHAVCAGTAEVRYVSRARRLPARGLRSAKAQCPGISSATGGGARVSKPTPRIELFASKPVDGTDGDVSVGDAWSGGAFNGTRKPRTLTVTAICVEPL